MNTFKRILLGSSFCILFGCQPVEIPTELGVTNITLTRNRIEHIAEKSALIRHKKSDVELSNLLKEKPEQSLINQHINVHFPNQRSYQQMSAIQIDSYIRSDHLRTPSSMAVISPLMRHHLAWYEQLNVDQLASIDCQINDTIDYDKQRLLLQSKCFMKISKKTNSKVRQLKWEYSQEYEIQEIESDYGVSTMIDIDTSYDLFFANIFKELFLKY